MKASEAHAAIAAWVDWAKANGNSKAAQLGWFFGGGKSLSAALYTKLDTAVIYYGRVTANADSLQKLNAPLLGHFGTFTTSAPEIGFAFFNFD